MCSKHPPKWCTYFTTLLGCYCHGWCHVKLHAAVSAHVLCTPHNHAPVYSHFIRSHICRVHLCLAITCHLHFWQNDRDLLCATQSPKQMGFGATIQWYQRGGMHTEITVITESSPRYAQGLVFSSRRYNPFRLLAYTHLYTHLYLWFHAVC